MGSTKPWAVDPYGKSSTEENKPEAFQHQLPHEDEVGGGEETEAAADEQYDENEELDETGPAGLAIDMYESDNELVIQSMIAGVTPDHLHVSITRDMVTISGRRVAPQGISEEQYIEHELYWGEFEREIRLPFEINTDGAEAIEKYGLLIIRLPRLNMRMQELKVKSA